MVATINHLTTNGKELARRIRALCNHFARYKGIPLETRGGKRTGLLLLDNKEVFLVCRAWLVIQEVGTVTPKGFRNAINQEILPSCLIVPKMPVAQDSIYRWLKRLGFTKKVEKKGVYINGHKRADVIAYRNNNFLLELAKVKQLSVRYTHESNGI
jgi:hypothetical protein